MYYNSQSSEYRINRLQGTHVSFKLYVNFVYVNFFQMFRSDSQSIRLSKYRDSSVILICSALKHEWNILYKIECDSEDNLYTFTLGWTQDFNSKMLIAHIFKKAAFPYHQSAKSLGKIQYIFVNQSSMWANLLGVWGGVMAFEVGELASLCQDLVRISLACSI